MLPPDWFEQLRAAYPRRKGQGWVAAKRQILKHLDNGESFDEILKGTHCYRRYIAESGEFVRMARTHFGPQMFWLEFDDDDCSNEITLDDTAGDCGLTRAEGEDNESLNKRIGIAQTKAMYTRG